MKKLQYFVLENLRNCTIIINLLKNEYIVLFQLVNLYNFCLKRQQLVIFACLDNFHDVERLYPPRSVQLSNNKASFDLEKKKLIKKLLVLECHISHVKVKTF